MKQRMSSTWSGPGHPHRARLLVEDPDPALAASDFRFFEEAGFDVALCAGPCEGEECPLVEGDGCRLAAHADVVLMGPGMADHRSAVAEAIHRLRPDLPIVVQLPRAESEDCPPGCIPSYYPISVDGQIRSLWRALDGMPTVARLADLLGW